MYTDMCEDLERRVAATPEDAESRYHLALMLMSDYEATAEPALLERARHHVSRAIEVRPSHAGSHALRGYLYDADIQRLRRDLTGRGMPADAGALLSSGFMRARSFLRAVLTDEAERAMVALERGPARRLANADRERCLQAQRQLESLFDPSRVPASLQELSAWASRYGVEDAHCRPLLLGRLPKGDRLALMTRVRAHADAIRSWLDGFGDGPLPPEATALMYLALGVEEIR